MTDPSPQPDDHVAAQRATDRAALLRVTEERDRLRAELELTITSHWKLNTALIAWERLLDLVPEGAEGPAQIVAYIMQLRVLAEAVKALAWEEQYEPGQECSYQLEAVMRALLALGPEWDWRKPKEPTA